MNAFDEALAITLWNQPIGQWLLALLVVLVACALGLVLRRSALRQAERLAATPRREVLELPLHVASRTRALAIVVASLWLGMRLLELPDKAARAGSALFTIVAFWQVGLWLSAGVLRWLDQRRRAAMEVDRAAIGTLGILGFIAQIAVWTLVLLLALDNLGVDITALLAGLGVGGIAVALAVQNILGDLFASLSITLDRPFVVGDFIIVDDFLGSVESIGIKSVRLRSLSGEQVIMSNADLLGSRVRNYGRMMERRVVFSIHVRPDTPRETLRRIPERIRALIEAQPRTRFDRSHFASYEEFALRFETVYYVLSPDYNVYMDIQQAINLGIHEMLEAEDVAFAYPARRLILPDPASGQPGRQVAAAG